MSYTEDMKTLDARALPAAAQEDLRRKAVNAVLAGMPQTHAAKTFGVTRQAVGIWMRRYRNAGESALTAQARGAPKREGILKPWQCALTVKTITASYPDQERLPGFWLWTRDAVRMYLQRKFDVTLSLSSVGRLLRRWGLTPQKPARRAYQRNDRACRQWMEETYPAIRKQAQEENAGILWGDECGFRSDHQAGTTYGKRGKTPVVPGPGTRFGCNMISAIDNRGHLAFMMYEGSLTGARFISFMRRLVKQAGRKVFLVVDNLRVHKCDKVVKWVAKHEKAIRLFYLPSYSPDLNPDEYLNNDVKSNAVGRRRPRNKTEMKANIGSYLRSTQKQPEVVKRLFQERHVRYAAV